MSIFKYHIQIFVTQIFKLTLQEDDKNRTIGINTEYLSTMDFDMHKYDKKFLINVSFDIIFF